jgi:hypothetical protein
VPVLVLEDKGVFDAIKESTTLIRKTWGESIIGSGSIMLVFIIIGVIGFLGVLATMMLGSAVLFGIALVLFIALVIVLAVVAAAMQGIFVTALYSYAKSGIVPAAYNKDLIQNAYSFFFLKNTGLTTFDQVEEPYGSSSASGLTTLSIRNP